MADILCVHRIDLFIGGEAQVYTCCIHAEKYVWERTITVNHLLNTNKSVMGDS